MRLEPSSGRMLSRDHRTTSHITPADSLPRRLPTAAPLQWRFTTADSTKETNMAKKKRKYSKSASDDVESAMHRKKKGTLRSGPGGKGGKVKSRKKTNAIGHPEERAKG